MPGRCLVAGLSGLACGAANGVYLLLVLRTIALARGIWRAVLSALWLVLALWPVPVVMFVVMPRVIGREGDESACFVLCWVAVWFGAFIWYVCTHPNPLQLDWRMTDQGDGQSGSCPRAASESAVAKRDAAGSGHIRRYGLLGTLGCGAGIALYLLLSRRAFVHYYLAATGCGVGLALYLLLFMRALRSAIGTRRKVLQWLWPPSLVLYVPLLLTFRVAGWKLGLVSDYAAQLGTPFLLGAPALGTVIWYVHRHPALQSTGLPKRSE